MSTAEATKFRSREQVWPLERVLFLLAGVMTAISALIGALSGAWFLLLTGFIALNQLAYVVFGSCPSSWALMRFLGFERGCAR